MSFVNNLIRQAKSEAKPAELIVPSNHLGAVVEHAAGCMYLEREFIRKKLMAGQLRMLNIPLRVVGPA